MGHLLNLRWRYDTARYLGKGTGLGLDTNAVWVDARQTMTTRMSDTH